jgi:hypothetical protein
MARNSHYSFLRSKPHIFYCTTRSWCCCYCLFHSIVANSTMSSSPSSGVARSSLYRPYHRSNSTSSSSSSLENLPPRTLSRVTREVRELIKNPPEGIRLVVDNETGLPSSLGEIVVSRNSICTILACHSEGTPVHDHGQLHVRTEFLRFRGARYSVGKS